MKTATADEELVTLLKKAGNYLSYLPALLEEAQMTGHAGNCTMLAREIREALDARK